MAIEIKCVYEKLKQIKENLVKLSYVRRTKSLLQQKLNEAFQLRNEFEAYSQIVLEQIENKQIQGKVLDDIQTYCDLIGDLYIQIEEFCSKDYSSFQSSIQGVESNSSNMANFDFKTAVSLLPVMTGNESVTLSLIDAIELYSPTLNDQGNTMLINFVLKTRLNQSAKLRLSDSYSNCESLISDMRTHLLTKKSSTSIHNELVQIRQNGMSLDQYGSKIEQLFVDLTVSQADGDKNAYKILQPLNEKLAIRSFTDGLKDRQLSVILSARNYTSLKDTIRAAKDEEVSCNRQNTEPSMYFSHRGKHVNRGSRGFYRGNKGNRSGYQNTSNMRGRTFFNSQASNRGQYQHNQPQRGRGNGYRQFRSSFRGRHNGNNTRNNINFMDNNTNNSPEKTNSNQNFDKSDQGEGLQFFRQ